MALASLNNLEKTFGKRTLFDKLSFSIDRGERVGLIGENGAGKTSLFKVLTGHMAVDVGSASVAKTVKIGHLKQDPHFEPGNTVLDEAELAFEELHRLSHQLRDLEHAMAVDQDEELMKTLETYEKVQHRFEEAGGYAWRHKLEATLHGVGLHEASWEQPVDVLSGGQKSRLALAKLLIAEPDLLLLDEPTNHLDLAAIEWLEEYLLKFDGAVLLISHDRYLLDRLCTRIVWLTDLKLNSYPGNYSSFVEQRELHELTRERAFTKQQADIDKQAEFVRRFKAGQRARQAKGREKRLNRLLEGDDLIRQSAASKTVNLTLDTNQRAGDRVLAVRELAKTYDGRTLWRDVKFELARADRVGIIGPNGSGKTTMLRVLLGDEPADAGEARWGANLKLGYYDQKLDDFDPAHTVLQEVSEGRPEPEKQLRDALAAMLFRGDAVDKSMSLLSGGERARVALVKLLLSKPNVLILDEPTNHLDIPSREALESTLAQYPGTILCVSHDRYFLEQIATRMIVLDPPAAVDFEGTYHEWHERAAELLEKAEIRKAKSETKPKPEIPSSKSKATDNGQRTKDKAKDNPYLRPFGRLSVAELESGITDAEVELADAAQRLADPAVSRNPRDGRRARDEHEKLARKLEQLEEEYLLRAG